MFTIRPTHVGIYTFFVLTEWPIFPPLIVKWHRGSINYSMFNLVNRDLVYYYSVSCDKNIQLFVKLFIKQQISLFHSRF